MPVTFVGAGSQVNGTTGGLAPPYPSGWAEGDLLIMVGFTRNNAREYTPTTGFADLQYVTHPTQEARVFWSWKIAAAGDDTTPNFASGGSSVSGEVATAHVVAFRGADVVAPTAGTGWTSSGTSQNNGPVPGVTVPTDGAALLVGGKMDDYSSTPATPSGWTLAAAQETTLGSDASLVSFYTLTAGDTGTVTYDHSPSTNAHGVAVMFAVAPLPVGLYPADDLFPSNSLYPGTPVAASEGAASSAWSFTGAATGKRAPVGSASGSLTFTGTATGRRSPVGSASGSVTFAGTATGSTTRDGTAAGAWAYADSATGSTTRTGAATGATTWTGTATGRSERSGTATGATTWVATATGLAPLGNSAFGSWAFTGTATGRSERTGSATGATAWAGAATGTSARTGTASGATAWTGTATGDAPRFAAATGMWSFTGTASGTTVRVGSATGSVTWTGTAFGATPVRDITLTAEITSRALAGRLTPRALDGDLAPRNLTGTATPRRVTTALTPRRLAATVED